MQHGDIWRGVDRLAQKHGMSPSRLAKLAGLDATAFNKSKRVSKTGRLRWPSTESLARALAAVDEPFSDFARLVETGDQHQMPLLDLSQASKAEHFDPTGHPCGTHWNAVEITCPSLETDTYALEVPDDRMAPIYQAGDRLIISPTAQIRPIDRVVVMHVGGKLVIYEMGRLADQSVTLHTLSPRRTEQTLAKTDLAWIARILWVSQ